MTDNERSLYIGKFYFEDKSRHRLNSGEYTVYAKPEDFFTNWVWEEFLSDDWYDDEDRTNCYYKLYYVNSGSIKTVEENLILPICLDSAILLSEEEYKNVMVDIFTIYNGEEDELAIPRFGTFAEFMRWMKEQKVVDEPPSRF